MTVEPGLMTYLYERATRTVEPGRVTDLHQQLAVVTAMLIASPGHLS